MATVNNPNHAKHYKTWIFHNICHFDILAGIVIYRRVAKANLAISAKMIYLVIGYHPSMF